MSDASQEGRKINSGCGCDGVTASEENQVDFSRRRFAAATMATPVVATLLSRPVWGSSCSPTGFMSGNLSDHDHSECTGQGCTPGFWKTHPDLWSDALAGPFKSGACGETNNGGQCTMWNANTASATLWEDVFSFPPAIGSGATLLEVMLMHELAGSRGTYENHVVAALLNAFYAPYLYGATVEQIIEMVEYAETAPDEQHTWIQAFETLVAMNESDQCFMNAHGDIQGTDCGIGYVYVEGNPECVPVDSYMLCQYFGECAEETVFSQDGSGQLGQGQLKQNKWQSNSKKK